jgi:hypothetical protein
VLFGQIAIVELASCRPSASVQADSKSEDREDRQGRTTNMENRETRRKIIRQWASLPKDKRQTEDQAAEFAKKAIEQNELQPNRRDPYQRVMGWLLPRTAR